MVFLSFVYVWSGRCIPICATCSHPPKKGKQKNPQCIHRRKKKKRKLSFNEVNNTRHLLSYFYYTLPLVVTTSPQFSLPAQLTTTSCIWMKGDAQRRDKHTRVSRGNDKECCFATRKRKVHVSLTLCDAMWTLLHTFTHSLLQSHMQNITLISRVTFHHTKQANVGPGTMRELRGAR